MAITIYHAEARRSERVVWLLEELERPYELVFTPGDVFGSFKPIHATGHAFPVAPLVRDGEELLIESGAILETLLNRYGAGRLRPALDAPNHHAYLEWLHFAESTAAPRFMAELNVLHMPAEKQEAARARLFGGAKRVLDYIERRLTDAAHLAGEDFTAADIQMHLVLRIGLSAAAGRTGVPAFLLQPDAACFAPYPAIARYMQALEARAAFQRMRAMALPNGWPPF